MTRGNRLAQLRKANDISQYRLAKLSGVKQSVISSYETGKINPGIENLQKLLPHLGVTLAEFLLPETAEQPFIVPPERKLRLHQIIQALESMDDSDLRFMQGFVEFYLSSREEALKE